MLSPFPCPCNACILFGLLISCQRLDQTKIIISTHPNNTCVFMKSAKKASEQEKSEAKPAANSRKPPYAYIVAAVVIVVAVIGLVYYLSARTSYSKCPCLDSSQLKALLKENQSVNATAAYNTTFISNSTQLSSSLPSGFSGKINSAWQVTYQAPFYNEIAGEILLNTNNPAGLYSLMMASSGRLTGNFTSGPEENGLVYSYVSINNTATAAPGNATTLYLLYGYKGSEAFGFSFITKRNVSLSPVAIAENISSTI